MKLVTKIRTRFNSKVVTLAGEIEIDSNGITEEIEDSVATEMVEQGIGFEYLPVIEPVKILTNEETAKLEAAKSMVKEVKTATTTTEDKKAKALAEAAKKSKVEEVKEVKSQEVVTESNSTTEEVKNEETKVEEK